MEEVQVREVTKSVLHSIFQYLIIISVPTILCFYWPNHDERLMKFICFQIFSNILLVFSFLFTPKRTINDIYPALFLIASFINLMTHNMADYVSVGIGFILPAVISIYVISNHLHKDFVPLLKKCLIIVCLVNCGLFVFENLKVHLIFNVDKGYERSSGFMCYPASFALLCAVCMCSTWNYKKWLIVPMGICLLLSKEYSVIGGFLFTISIPFLWSFRKYTWVIIPIIIGILSLLWHTIAAKWAIRYECLWPVIQNIWARPIDGFGVGAYRNLPSSFFGFDRGNWSEMHCEPLDLFFSMGIIGVAIFIGWLRSVIEHFKWNCYTQSMVIIGITSCFHSPFHFADTIWISVIILSLYYVDQYDHSS